MMLYDPKIHHRRSVRLQGFDYSQAGAYFVTICTANHECSLGDIINGNLILSENGKIAEGWFDFTQSHFTDIEIPFHVVMPNHIHMVVEIFDSRTGAVSAPQTMNANHLGGETPPVQAQKSLLAKIIAYYKYQTTKQINLAHQSAGIRFWHRNYYDHIIRNEAENENIYLYIVGNPQKWLEDQLHPDSAPNRFNHGN